MKSKIILGTAKFGFADYGFSSNHPQLSSIEMLVSASKLGIGMLDTSPRYGNAEKMIGDYHKKNETQFRVCTKVDDLSADVRTSEREIYDSVLNSLKDLDVDVIDTLYLHQNEIQIISDQNIIKALRKLKCDGLAKKIGVSVYSVEECDFALNCSVYDVIQLPISILDSHIYSQIVENGAAKEIVARSLFLQGVLFNRSAIRGQIKQADDLFRSLSEIDDLAVKHKVDLLDLAVSFVASLPKVDQIIVGTTCEQHLLAIVSASETKLSGVLYDQLKSKSAIYKDWGNPRNWRKVDVCDKRDVI